MCSEAVVQFMGEKISPHIATEINTVSCKGNCTQYLITSSFKLFAIAAQDIYDCTIHQKNFGPNGTMIIIITMIIALIIMTITIIFS